MSSRRVEEGFRVLTLTANVDEDELNFIRRYQVLASYVARLRLTGGGT